MPVTYNRVILAFTSNVDGTAAINALRQGLQATCAQLPYLKGRVTKQHGDRLAISWSEQDQSPILQEIQRPSDIPASYAQLKRESLPSHRLPQSLCPVAGWVAASFPDGNAPVIAASYTRLDGGLLLTLCVHHNVMDGTGTGHLISLWANNTKGELSNPLPDAQEPQHRQDQLKAVITAPVSKESDPISDSDGTFESLLAAHPEYTTALLPPRSPKPECTSRIFTFPVDTLKSRATGSKTSVNNVLCALIWSCISTVRSLRWQKESTESGGHGPTNTKLGMAVNGRARIGESFAKGRPYLGNVNLYCVTNLDLTLLTAIGLSPSPEAPWAFSDVLATVIDALSTSIARIDRRFISQVITLTERAPDPQALLPGWDFFNGPDITITSWANLDTYSVDFGPGLGMPDFVRVPYLEVDGLNIVLPRKRSSAPETIEVVVMLRKDDMADLERNAMWRHWTNAPIPKQ